MVFGMCSCFVLIFNVTCLWIVLSKFQNLSGATLISNNLCNCFSHMHETEIGRPADWFRGRDTDKYTHHLGKTLRAGTCWSQD